MSTTRNTILLGLAVAAIGAPCAQAGTTPVWRHALEVRSTGLNREYGLGRFAVPASAGSAAQPAWLKALAIRGRAMNERYHLGTYAAPRHFIDGKKLGMLAASAAALLASGLVVIRRSRRAHSRVPTSA
jgi:hypothetical protein